MYMRMAKKNSAGIVSNLNHSAGLVLTTQWCGNISGHALMGRPAARLDTMGFVDNLVCCSSCFR